MRRGLYALAAELEATPPPAPWVDAPDGPGHWRAGLPGQRPINLRVSEVAVTPEGSAGAVLLDVWLAYHPGWRYQRYEPVTVPPRADKEDR